MADKPSRRDLVKKAAYIAPVILTLKVEPAVASYGSPGPEWPGRGKGRHRRKDDDREEGRGGRRRNHKFGFLRGLSKKFFG